MPYTPPASPKINTLDEMLAFVQDQLLAIARSQNVYDVLQLTVTYRVPIRPRPGMMVYADGTQWNPGGGQGVYVLNLANAWVKL